MIETIAQYYGEQAGRIELLLLMVNIIVHVFFAGGVAKDAGEVYRLGGRTALVSAHIWAFATLIGGITVAAVYWFIHHSTLTVGTAFYRGEKK